MLLDQQSANRRPNPVGLGDAPFKRPVLDGFGNLWRQPEIHGVCGFVHLASAGSESTFLTAPSKGIYQWVTPAEDQAKGGFLDFRI
jgi:hypothetical protein